MLRRQACHDLQPACPTSETAVPCSPQRSPGCAASAGAGEKGRGLKLLTFQKSLIVVEVSEYPPEYFVWALDGRAAAALCHCRATLHRALVANDPETRATGPAVAWGNDTSASIASQPRSRASSARRRLWTMRHATPYTAPVR